MSSWDHFHCVTMNCSSLYPKPMCSWLYPLFPHSFSSQFLSCTTNLYCTISISISTWPNTPIFTQSLLTSYFFLATTAFPCVHDLNLEKLPVSTHDFWPSFSFSFFQMLPHSPLQRIHLSKNHLYVAKSYGHESFLMLISHLTTPFSFRIFLSILLATFSMPHCQLSVLLRAWLWNCKIPAWPHSSWGFECYLYFP